MRGFDDDVVLDRGGLSRRVGDDQAHVLRVGFRERELQDLSAPERPQRWDRSRRSTVIRPFIRTRAVRAGRGRAIKCDRLAGEGRCRTDGEARGRRSRRRLRDDGSRRGRARRRRSPRIARRHHSTHRMPDVAGSELVARCRRSADVQAACAQGVAVLPLVGVGRRAPRPRAIARAEGLAFDSRSGDGRQHGVRRRRQR